jgi:hypothetical protein
VSRPETVAAAEQHRQAQLGLRSRALRDFLAIWPLWTGDTESFGRLVQAAQPLVTVYRHASSALAGGFYQSFRGIRQIPGQAAVRLAANVPAQQLASSMYVTGQVMTRDAVAAGQSFEEARRTALARVSGAVTRHVLDGGRQTIIDTAYGDERAIGWARLTDGKPCAFCAMLAGRGAVYKTESTADFQAHDHCGCQAIPIFTAADVPALNRELRDLYNQAQRDAARSGDLDRGTSNDQLNAFRRLYDPETLTVA